MSLRNQIVFIVLLLIVILTVGALSFSYVEGLDLFDSFYWAVTVLSTVGFGDVVPKTMAGKIVYMALVTSGIGLYGYFVTNMVSLISESRLRNLLFRYLIESRRLKELRDHTIIIGWNRFAETAYEELMLNNKNPLVVVDDEERARSLSQNGVNVVLGDLSNIDTLRKVGLDRCLAVIIALESLEKQLIHLLRIRSVDRSVPIVVLNRNKKMKNILYQAGATRVVDAFDIVGRLLASSVFEPLACDVLMDLAESRNMINLEQAESHVEKTVGELVNAGLQSMIIAVEREGKVHYLPDNSFKVNKGDKLVLVTDNARLKNDLKILSKMQ